MLSFFSCFWLVVGVVSFVLQVLLGKLALEKLGIVVTIALLPVVVVFGGAFALAVPGLWSTAVLRGGEATHRNSLFRAAYEMLYTPLPEEKKRSTKTLIDVGFDRLGTMVAAGIVVLVLAIASARAEMVLLVLAVGVALATLTRSRALHTGYVSVLEESLRLRATGGDLAAATITMAPDESAAGPAEKMGRLESSREAMRLFGQSFAAVTELESRDPARVGRVLSGDRPLARPVVPFALLLLADDRFHVDAMRALRKVRAGTPRGRSSTPSATRRRLSTSGGASLESSRSAPPRTRREVSYAAWPTNVSRSGTSAPERSSRSPARSRASR